MPESMLARIEIPASLRFLNPAADFIRSVGDDVGLDDAELNDLQLAFEEILVNTIVHGLSEDPKERIEISCERLLSGVEIMIRDKGIPFDPERIPDYSPEQAMEGRLDGLGSYLAQRSLDDLSYFHLGKEGNLTILVKHGDMYRADEPEEEEQKTPASEPKPVPEEYAVRIIEEQDAYEIARCAYRAYGYGYEMFIYYPERIIQMNRAGLLHSVVAVLPNDELLGHLGIKVPVVGASVAEMGVGFVNPEYRGGGVFKRMHALVFDVAKENNLMGLFVHAVTNHVFSQKAGSFFGLKNCALLLAKLRTNDKFIGIGENTDLRLANLVMHILLIPSERETLYVPEQHQEMVQRIMGQFGFSGQIVSNTDVIPDAGADTVMRSSFQKEMNYNEIFVEEIGENWESNLRSRWKHCLLEKQDVIYLYLDMANPMTPRVCEVCESWGFFFAGVLPNALREHDALILQYLNHQQVVPDQIHLHDDFAQELLDYICKQPPVVELLESQGKGE